MIRINLQVGTILDGDATIKSIVGSSIYPVTFPQKKGDTGIPFPCITYSRTVQPPSKLDHNSEGATITIQAFCSSYKASIALAEAIKTAMESNDFFMAGCVDDYYFPAYFQRMTFDKKN